MLFQNLDANASFPFQERNIFKFVRYQIMTEMKKKSPLISYLIWRKIVHVSIQKIVTYVLFNGFGQSEDSQLKYAAGSKVIINV